MTLTRPISTPTPTAPRVRSLARAAYKFAGSVVRRFKVIPEATNWPQRAEVCERCPMRVVQCGISYCGKPFARLPIRDTVTQGCGCPTRAKAKDPAEHCPLTVQYVAAVQSGDGCDCKWCRLVQK